MAGSGAVAPEDPPGVPDKVGEVYPEVPDKVGVERVARPEPGERSSERSSGPGESVAIR
jgi:hypothetical protein